MLKIWDNAVVTEVNMAIYVKIGAGVPVHNNRAFHGFVINDTCSNKKIHFSDGTVIDTKEYELHYLPKGSNYRVETVTSGGCWAINFDLLEEIEQKPFNIAFRNPESIVKIFKDATVAWAEKKDFHNTIIRKSIYEIIAKIRKEQQRNYLPSDKELLIKPAVEAINRDFTKNDLSVKALAELCGISEAYLRRIFIDKYSLSPKEYIISLRIDHAKRLLESAQFTVSEIAEMCGYFEPCHFSREFKKYYGVSPASYAKASRQ